MALINTKKTALFLKSGGTLPVAPANFIELDAELALTPNIPVEEFKRVNGSLGQNDSYADTCKATITGVSINHKMRMSNSAGDNLDAVPEYGELLKIGGFTETIGVDTVVYTNTQTPVKGSAVAYIDGWKQTMTGSVAADLSFDFSIGKAGVITASLSAYLDNKGVAVSATNPTVTLSPEPCLMVNCTDIITAGGTAVKADKITIAMGADIQDFYGLGLKEFSMQDYSIKVTADFYPENADYNVAINKINSQTVEALVIKLGTDNSGALVDGKSVLIECDTAKASSFSDSIDKSTLKRSFVWLLQGSEQISIKHGNHS